MASNCSSIILNFTVGTLFFVVGGYWLLRSLKDPIMSTIDGVHFSLTLLLWSSAMFPPTDRVSRDIEVEHVQLSQRQLINSSETIPALTQVEYIPQAKIASLFVVFGLVIVCKWRTLLIYSPCLLLFGFSCHRSSASRAQSDWDILINQILWNTAFPVLH